MTLQKLPLVQGLEGKFNDILFLPCQNPDVKSTVVFFGGDVQDYEEKMAAHRDNRAHKQWCLENTTALIAKRFPQSHVVTVHPARMHLGTLSCYDNFVESTLAGAPQHSSSPEALQHLELLLRNAQSGLAELPLVLVGFSKGCVVLNQMVYALAASHTPAITIQEMYWLDGGHPGGSNTWVTDKSILQKFAATGIKAFVHVTPYQMECSLRPWIKKEERIFRDTLTRLGAPVQRTMHFKTDPRSLEMHFKILEHF